MTLQESLDSLVSFNAENVRDLQEKVGMIPQLLKDATDKAVADYIEANPPPPDTGPVTLDGVTYDSLIAAMQSITTDSKTVFNNAAVIPGYFESQMTHGNPWWPNDPPSAEPPADSPAGA